MDNDLPPILKTRGLRLIEIGEDRDGVFLKFAANHNRVREVTLYMITPGPASWKYVYAIYDPTTRTVVTYKGKHGDPAKDRRTNISGA